MDSENLAQRAKCFPAQFCGFLFSCACWGWKADPDCSVKTKRSSTIMGGAEVVNDYWKKHKTSGDNKGQIYQSNQSPVLPHHLSLSSSLFYFCLSFSFKPY